MNIFRDLHALPAFKNAVITIGSFDGVHRGHQKIIRHLNALAREHDGESLIVTFDPHPRSIVYPGDTTLRLLTTLEEKLHLFRLFNVDHVVVVPFTVEFSQLSAKEYIERFLVDKFQPRHIVIGYDHRFGRNRAGSVSMLRDYAQKYNFEITQIAKQEIDDITISSTKIRNAILDADIRKANKLLNHAYQLTGQVIHGKKVGKRLGFPTANIAVAEPSKLIPAEGIYAIRARLHGDIHDGMLYIGKRPTINSETLPVIEVNLFDFNDEIYGETVSLELLAFVRHDRKFNTLDALRDQIRRDKASVLSVLNDQPAAVLPSVGVVALNYNGRKVMEKYLPTFRDQRYGNLDVVVADNGSKDDSVDFLEREYDDIQCIELKRNYGFAGGYNRALRSLQHKYFALVNTDVELTPGWLDPIIEMMEADPHIAVCQPKILDAKNKSRFEYAGGSGGWIDLFGYPFCRGRILNHIEEDIGQYDDVAEIFWCSGAAFVIRSDLFKKFGGFDKAYFAHQEEIDLCWRLKRAGYKIMVQPQSVIYHEGGATLPYESPKKVFLNFRNNLATLIKHVPLGQTPLVLIFRLFADALAGLRFLLTGQWKNTLAIVHAYVLLIIWFPGLVHDRFRLRRLMRQHSIAGSNRQGIFRGCLLFRYYLFGKTRFSDLDIS